MNKEGEPSVEDILRSIKQVISREDEGAQGEARSGSAPGFGNNPFARRDAFTRPTAVPSAANAPADSEEVYDLAALPDGEAPSEPEAVAPDETVSLPAGFQVHRYESAAPWQDGEADDEPLTLSTLITPEDGDDFGAGEESVGEEEPEAETPPAAPTPEEAPRPEATAAPASEGEGLLAGAAAAAVRAQLSALDNLSASAPKAKAADNPLEDMVKEMLRPMLKDWLDANLQTIIERMVQDEIARITGRR
ncbi:DUF2497 domain-containing protein [Croceicoccus sediminis]|uniref:DUF2497 domain-containing protein n=1 Tax=Croceicoccus sediminis TaxID=2571150 RepID=UPI001478949C|nr:DUF2497 domain-containing protein [Croceicoccus sediminis]